MGASAITGIASAAAATTVTGVAIKRDLDEFHQQRPSHFAKLATVGLGAATGALMFAAGKAYKANPSSALTKHLTAAIYGPAAGAATSFVAVPFVEWHGREPGPGALTRGA